MRGSTNNDNDYQGFLVVDIEEACKEWYKLTQFYEIPDTGDAIDIEEKIKHNEKVRLIVNKIKKLGSVEAPKMADLKDSFTRNRRSNRRENTRKINKFTK